VIGYGHRQAAYRNPRLSGDYKPGQNDRRIACVQKKKKAKNHRSKLFAIVESSVSLITSTRQQTRALERQIKDQHLNVMGIALATYRTGLSVQRLIGV
jgi:hypothetical protein